MRTNLILSGLVTIAFLAASAGMALAQGGGGGSTHEPEERQARAAALREARNESLRSFQENRSAALDHYRAAHNATKASFLENKTLVIDECRALRNASAEDDNSQYSKCVSDGLKPLIDQARAAHEEQKTALRSTLLAAREAAKASFLAARQAHGPRHASG